MLGRTDEDSEKEHFESRAGAGLHFDLPGDLPDTGRGPWRRGAGVEVQVRGAGRQHGEDHRVPGKQGGAGDSGGAGRVPGDGDRRRRVPTEAEDHFGDHSGRGDFHRCQSLLQLRRDREDQAAQDPEEHREPGFFQLQGAEGAGAAGRA